MYRSIVKNIKENGWVVFNNAIDAKLISQLLVDAKQLKPTFRKARIGRNTEQNLNKQVRSDKTLWLNDSIVVQKAFLNQAKLI